MDRIVAAMPADNSRLTTQKAFYVPISRSRNRAGLVADGARKRAGQLQGAAVECVAALDGLAPQAAHKTAFRIGNRAEREIGRVPEATEHGHEAGRGASSERGRESGPRQDTGRDRNGNLPEQNAEHNRNGRESVTTSPRSITAVIVRTGDRAKPGRESDAIGVEAGRTRPPNVAALSGDRNNGQFG